MQKSLDQEIINSSKLDWKLYFVELQKKYQKDKNKRKFSQSFTDDSFKYFIKFGNKFYKNILQMCTQIQQKTQNIKKNLTQNIKGTLKDLQQLKQLILAYQKLTEQIDPRTKTKQLRECFLNQPEQAVQILQKIICHRQKYDLTKYGKLIEDKILEWKCEGFKFQHQGIYESYKVAVEQLGIKETYKNKEDFIAAYHKYVIQRHFHILQTIKKLNNPILLKFYGITKQQDFKGIRIQMEKGLLLPLMAQYSRVMTYRDYFKFYHLFSNKIKLKFVKQITENLKLLNSNGIWHNDIRILNIVYSVQDNRFKFIERHQRFGS